MSDISMTNAAPEGSNLCDWCSRLDFQGWFQIGRAKRDAERSKIKIRNLGYLDEIQKKTACAFCRMVVHIAKQHFNSDFDLTTDFAPRLRCLVTPIEVRQVETKRASKPQPIRRLQIHFYEGASSISPYQIQLLDDSVTGEELDLWKADQQKRGKSVNVNVEDLKIFQPFAGVLGNSGGLLASEDLDISLVQRWLDTCIKDHEGTCSILREDRGDRTSRTLVKGGFEMGTDLRVIDVMAMQLCPAPEGVSYCALSYLWGGVSMATTTKDNFHKLSQENGIREDEVPLSVRDAIHFCRKIGWQYLWVDALCIIQDDAVDQASQISQMQAIYRFADFTIVAASGINSNAGLPGLHTPRKVSQYIEKIAGLRLVTTLPPFQHILETSKWNTRGWTFQESMLSRRLIIFSEGQMHFKCEGGHFCEDTSAVATPKGTRTAQPGYAYMDTKSKSLLGGAPYGDGFGIFQDLVAQYSQRQLTNSDDVLNGFSGIVNALRPFGSIGQYWCAGMPLGRNLVESLSWFPTYNMPNESRRLNADQADFQRRVGKYKPVHPPHYKGKKQDGSEIEFVDKFPSWSWIGWTGQIDYLNPPGYPKIDCEASADHFHLTITARKLSFNIKRLAKGDIAMTFLSTYAIEDSSGEVISDFVHNYSLIKYDEIESTKRFDFLLLTTFDPKCAEVLVRPRQWKPTDRYIPYSEVISQSREAHNGPYLNAMMISRPLAAEEKPERVAMVYIPQKYWDANGVVRETVVIG